MESHNKKNEDNTNNDMDNCSSRRVAKLQLLDGPATGADQQSIF